MRPEILTYLRELGLEESAMLVPTTGMVYGVTMVAIVFVFVRRTDQIGFPADQSLMVAAVTGVAGLLGARVYYWLGAGVAGVAGPVGLLVSDNAGSWGGYFGGMVGMTVYLKIIRTDATSYLDVAVGAALLAPAIGRWGCLLAGCDFGRVTSLPWAIQYPAGSHAFQAHVASGAIPPDALHSLPVHPLPLYLSLNALVLFVIITAIWWRTRHRPGTTLASAWFLYGLTRFFWEFLRDPDAGGATSGFSLPQWMALTAIGVAGAAALVASRRWRLDPVPAGQAG